MKMNRPSYLSSLVFFLAWTQTAIFAFDCKASLLLDPSELDEVSYEQQIGSTALKNLLLLEPRLQMRTRDNDDMEGLGGLEHGDTAPHSDHEKFKRAFERLESAYLRLGLVCQLQKSEESDDGSFLRMYFKFVAAKGFHSLGTCIEQSFLSADGLCSVVIEHIVVPGSKGLGRKVLEENQSLLVSGGFDQISLEAASGPRGLVGAFVWSRLGFEFVDGSSALKLKEELSKYLKRLHPNACPQEVESWLDLQSLNSPSDFARLKLDRPSDLGQNRERIVSSLGLLRPSRLWSLRFQRKTGYELGKAFLLDPTVAATWNGVKRLES